MSSIVMAYIVMAFTVMAYRKKVRTRKKRCAINEQYAPMVLATRVRRWAVIALFGAMMVVVVAKISADFRMSQETPHLFGAEHNVERVQWVRKHLLHDGFADPPVNFLKPGMVPGGFEKSTECEVGYQGPHCETKSCEQNCNHHGDCIDGVCSCYDDFRGTRSCRR